MKAARNYLIGLVNLVLLVWPAQALAQAYGQSAYNTQTYASNTVTIPGIGTLPITGTTISLAVLSAATIAGAVGLLMWARRKRRQTS